MTNLGTVYISQLITTKSFDAQKIDAKTYNLGIINQLVDLNPKTKVLDPNKGQIWPRGMVGEYHGEAAGTIIIFNFIVYPPEANAIEGQLWPRGDFIPEVDS